MKLGKEKVGHNWGHAPSPLPPTLDGSDADSIDTDSHDVSD